MAHLKKELLEHLIRECVSEVLDEINISTVKAKEDLKPDKVSELKSVIKKMIKEAFAK